MPTNRTRKSRAYIEQETPKWQLEYLKTGKEEKGSYAFWRMTESDWQAVYLYARDDLLRSWLEKHPGTRPYGWWLFEAPEERRQIKGKGTRADTVFCYKQYFVYGIPRFWVKDSIGENNPPIFESQHAYLKRLKLLTPAESDLKNQKRTESLFTIDFSVVLDGRKYL